LFLQAYNRAVGIAIKLANHAQSARYIAHKHKLYKNKRHAMHAQAMMF